MQDFQDTHRPSERVNVVQNDDAEPNYTAAYGLRASDFIRWAYENYEKFDEGEVWQSPFWRFVRLVKGHTELIGLTSKVALQRVEQTLNVWKGRLNVDAWEHYFVLSKEDAQVEFMGCWEKVRFVPGWDPLDQAIEQAKKMQLIPPTDRTVGYQNFVSIAGWLQVTMGNRNIMLPCEKMSEHLNCTPMTISRYRRWAVEDGLVQMVKEHRFKSAGGGEATEFRFDTSQYKCLAQTAEKA